MILFIYCVQNFNWKTENSNNWHPTFIDISGSVGGQSVVIERDGKKIIFNRDKDGVTVNDEQGRSAKINRVNEKHVTINTTGWSGPISIKEEDGSIKIDGQKSSKITKQGNKFVIDNGSLFGATDIIVE